MSLRRTTAMDGCPGPLAAPPPVPDDSPAGFISLSASPMFDTVVASVLLVALFPLFILPPPVVPPPSAAAPPAVETPMDAAVGKPLADTPEETAPDADEAVAAPLPTTTRPPPRCATGLPVPG